MYILDTNVVKRMYGKDKDDNVVNWINSIDDNEIFFSVGLIMENHKGIETARKKRNSDHAVIRAFKRKIKLLDFKRMLVYLYLWISQLRRNGTASGRKTTRFD